MAEESNNQYDSEEWNEFTKPKFRITNTLNNLKIFLYEKDDSTLTLRSKKILWFLLKSACGAVIAFLIAWAAEGCTSKLFPPKVELALRYEFGSEKIVKDIRKIKLYIDKKRVPARDISQSCEGLVFKFRASKKRYHILGIELDSHVNQYAFKAERDSIIKNCYIDSLKIGIIPEPLCGTCWLNEAILNKFREINKKIAVENDTSLYASRDSLVVSNKFVFHRVIHYEEFVKDKVFLFSIRKPKNDKPKYYSVYDPANAGILIIDPSIGIEKKDVSEEHFLNRLLLYNLSQATPDVTLVTEDLLNQLSANYEISLPEIDPYIWTFQKEPFRLMFTEFLAKKSAASVVILANIYENYKNEKRADFVIKTASIESLKTPVFQAFNCRVHDSFSFVNTKSNSFECTFADFIKPYLQAYQHYLDVDSVDSDVQKYLGEFYTLSRKIDDIDDLDSTDPSRVISKPVQRKSRGISFGIKYDPRIPVPNVLAGLLVDLAKLNDQQAWERLIAFWKRADINISDKSIYADKLLYLLNRTKNLCLERQSAYGADSLDVDQRLELLNIVIHTITTNRSLDWLNKHNSFYETVDLRDRIWRERSR